jgi:hypothetical protein
MIGSKAAIVRAMVSAKIASLFHQPRKPRGSREGRKWIV